MLCSTDPVALDQACVDLCNKQTAFRNSQLGENLAKGEKTGQIFHDSNPHVDWEAALIQGEKIGLGSRKYNLIEMK